MMIAYAIVLYNKNIEDSNTFFFLKSYVDKSQILVFDNSDNPELCLNNEKKCKSEEITYLSQNENIGLSKAYNCILNNIFAESQVNFTYICWLDDDTILESKFLKEQEEAVKEKYDIFVPKIKGQDGIIYSPNEAGFIKNKLVVSQNHVPEFQKFNAINSCLTVNLEIYKEYRYNELLFLDQVDQLFFDELRSKNPKYTYKVGNSIVFQNFSQRDSVLNEVYHKRFCIRAKDILRYGEISPENNIFLSYLKNCLLGFSFFLKTRKWKYLNIGMFSIWDYKK